MSRSITIRDVPDEVVDELAARASSSGRSLQEYLRGHLVDVTSRPELSVWLEQVRVHREASGARLTAEEIIAARDADRT
ncbi:MAG TPA: hypothetical protein VIE19_06745 [Lapillicoccus sp.]|jgi:plasmid stability protein